MGQIYIKSEHGHCDFLDVGSRRILRDPNFLLKKSVRDLNIFFLNFLIYFNYPFYWNPLLLNPSVYLSKMGNSQNPCMI